MVTRRIQNPTLLGPVEKEETLKPVEEYSFFRPPLLFMFSSSSMTTTIPRCPGMSSPSQFGQLNDVTFIFVSIHQHVSQSGSTDLSFTFFFSQSSSIPMFLTGPFSFLLHWQFVALILLIARTKCRKVRGSCGPSSVRTLCPRCSDFTISCPVLGTHDITAVLYVIFNTLRTGDADLRF